MKLYNEIGKIERGPYEVIGKMSELEYHWVINPFITNIDR